MESKRKEKYRMFFGIKKNSDAPFRLVIADFITGQLKVDVVDPMNFFNLVTTVNRKYESPYKLLREYQRMTKVKE